MIKCDKCLQEIPHTHVEHLEKMKDQYQSELVDIVEDFEKLTAEKLELLQKKTKVQSKVSELQNQINDAKLSKQKLAGLKTSLAQYKESLENLKLDELPDLNLEDHIKTVQERQQSELLKFQDLKQKLEDYETCRFVIGDDGVKSMIVKTLMDMLNASIQSYISRLGMNMRCKFDEYFEEKITNDKGEEMSYYNLSGAERRTVDIACAWAFKDIKRKVSNVSSNVEFLDEILDGQMDEIGLDLLIGVLKDRIDKQGLSCYVISHRKETEKHIDGETVYLVKENRITKRIDKK